MILVDLNQVMISNLMMNLQGNQGAVDENLVRHMVFNSLRMYKQRFGEKYGNMIICCDDKNYWRRDIFPHYKASRKDDREKSPYDWNEIFTALNSIRDEIRENAPYKVIQVERAEADDIIAVLCKQANEKVLIVSGDKDFQQLHKYDYVKQWSPNLNQFVVQDRPEEFLKEHTLRGDKSDGIPNILSNDNCMVEGIRQTPLRKPVFDAYMRMTIESDDKYYRNYLRNQTLIDFDFIPEDVESRILQEYEKTEVVQGKVFDYLRTHRLDDLLTNVEDFRL